MVAESTSIPTRLPLLHIYTSAAIARLGQGVFEVRSSEYSHQNHLVKCLLKRIFMGIIQAQDHWEEVCMLAFFPNDSHVPQSLKPLF